MANPEQLRKLEEGVEAWNKWREQNPDIKPDLEGAYLKKANFIGENLKLVNFSYANLTEANLHDADLMGANLKSAILENANFDQANLSYVTLTKANLYNAHLGGANLKSALLREANLTRVNLRAANLEKANIIEAKLIAADLTEANLTEAALIDVDFRESILKENNLKETDLTRAEITGQMLRGVNFSTIELNETNLSHTDLTEASFNGCHLREVNLTGANLKALQAVATSFERVIFTGVCIEDWNISQSKFLEVECDYIFRKLIWNQELFDFCKPYPIEEDKIFKPGEFERFVKRIEETNNSIWDNGIDRSDSFKSDKLPEIKGVQEISPIQNIYNYHISRDIHMSNCNNTNHQNGKFGIGINNSEIKDNVKLAGIINEAEQQTQYKNSFNHSDSDSDSDSDSNTTQSKIDWKWIIGIILAFSALLISGLLNPEFRRILKLDKPQENQLKQSNINIRDQFLIKYRVSPLHNSSIKIN